MTVITVVPAAPTELAALEDCERLIVWACRYWLACRRARRDPMPLLRDVFGDNGARDAALSVDAVLRILGAAADRAVELRCTACPRLSADEMCLLAAVAALQQGAQTTARALLEGWLVPRLAEMALVPLRGLALLLAQAGLALPWREGMPDGMRMASSLARRLH